MFGPLDPLDPALPSPALANWQEHQRRQRTLRMLMMFLMILLLMDGDDPVERRNARKHPALRNNLGERTRYGYFKMYGVDENGDLVNPLGWSVWKSRREEDGLLLNAAEMGSRYRDLVNKSKGHDLEKDLRRWAENRVVAETKVILGLVDKPSKDDSDRKNALLEHNYMAPSVQPEFSDDAQVFHYPRNATGYYRGHWMRVPNNRSGDYAIAAQNDFVKADKTEVSSWVQQQLRQKDEEVGLFIVPPFVNSTANSAVSTKQRIFESQNTTLKPPSLSLTKEVGRAAFQLYSRPIPAMTELSIVDGLVKLYDGMTTSFVSRRTDVLLRVRGVIIHSSGKMSLVSSSIANETLLGIKHNTSKEDATMGGDDNEQTFVQVEEENVDEVTDRQRHRRLQDLLSAFLSHPDSIHEPPRGSSTRSLFRDASSILSQLRDGIIELYAPQIFSLESMQNDGWVVLQSFDEGGDFGFRPGLQSKEKAAIHQSRALLQSNKTDIYNKEETIHQSYNQTAEGPPNTDHMSISRAVATSEEDLTHSLGNIQNSQATSSREKVEDNNPGLKKQLKEPKYIYPFPYVYDDVNESIKKSSSPASRRLPSRELALEANAENCQFEMNIDIHQQPWTFGEWRNIILQRFRTVQAFNPYLKKFDREAERLKRSQILDLKSQVGFAEDSVKEALVMTMSGYIESTNCNFTSFLNVTAIRTNWEHTTAKAINYSFYMMLTCLVQIVVLLRQLLHTQAQSAASNVSLFSVGWQTVLDAILCIAHIFLCLVMQPLFTAFASVAFFKLLIFCVIEMKYMALIIQARNNANNPNHTQDELRRQITLLHLRFYAALMIAIMAFWYIGQMHRTLYLLLLYSFWVPQIVLNTITEARKPMHPYYIYGMSTTRLIAPIYVFSMPNNFLKEVNPDFPSDAQMCELLILWVLIQTAILIGQGKYGARFMIPQR